MIKLGVNIDHVATLREARKSAVPDPVIAAAVCEASGADSIVVHLREDRRHIHDRDVAALRGAVMTRLNLEMSIAPAIVKVACRLKPDQSTLVPEKRQELTTEGGLDVVKLCSKVGKAAASLMKKGIPVSLFIEPDRRQIKAASRLGVPIIELHTGRYANSRSSRQFKRGLREVADAVAYAHGLGLEVNAGHGLDYENTPAVARLGCLHELNIGYAIICHSVFVGLAAAVGEMKALIRKAQPE